MGHHYRRSTGPLGPVDGLHVIRAYGNRIEPELGGGGLRWHGRMGKNGLVCADGFTLSVLAGPRGCYCWPRPGFPMSVGIDGALRMIEFPVSYRGPYAAFEVGYPTARPEPWHAWREHASDPEDWTFIYAYVPYLMIRALVDLHGGLARMQNGVTRSLPPPETFTCPACDSSTPNPDDVAQQYCPSCHWYTGVPELAAQRPELFTQHGRRPPENPWDHDHDCGDARTDR